MQFTLRGHPVRTLFFSGNNIDQFQWNRGHIAPSQSARFLFGASRWMEGSGSDETRAFVSTKLSSLLKGENIDLTSPPPIDLVCSHISKVNAFSFQLITRT